MEIYRIESDTMVRIPSKELDEEQQLETRLVRTDTARIGGVDILYIGRQGTFGEAGIFDILGVDEAGNTVIVELKRDNAPRSVITQALEYGSEIRNASYESLKNEYEGLC
jgi:RecB family endonuclease NucS